jgi:hypothetical protein
MRTTKSLSEITHMKITERNPDIRLDREKVPTGMVVVEGKNLQITARSKKIPFGVAYDVGNMSRQITVGLVLRKKDVARFEAALAARHPAPERLTGRAE